MPDQDLLNPELQLRRELEEEQRRRVVEKRGQSDGERARQGSPAPARAPAGMSELAHGLPAGGQLPIEMLFRDKERQLSLGQAAPPLWNAGLHLDPMQQIAGNGHG